MNNLAEEYYLRDCKNNVDQKSMILSHIKKLGYYNISKLMLFEQLHKRYLIKLIENNKIDFTKSLDYYISQYKKSEDYRLCEEQINNQIERKEKLEKYLNTNKLKDFYDDCTIDEMYYLGY